MSPRRESAPDEPGRLLDGRLRGALLAARVVALLAPGATALLGSSLVRRAAEPPPVVGVTALGEAFSGALLPFRPDDLMIDAWLASLVRTLGEDPARAVASGTVTREAATFWSEGGEGSASLVERRVRAATAEGVVVEVRLGRELPGRLPAERFARLSLRRAPFAPGNPLGLVLVDLSWIDAEAYDEPERRKAWARHLGGDAS